MGGVIMTFGQYIKQYRFEHGMSLRAFSERSGISFSQLSAFENGKVNTPSFKTYAAVASAMGLTVKELAERCDTIVTAAGDKQLSEREQLAVLVNELSDEQVHSLLALLGKR